MNKSFSNRYKFYLNLGGVSHDYPEFNFSIICIANFLKNHPVVLIIYIYVLSKNHSPSYYTFTFIGILVKKILRLQKFELFSKKY